jgi:hypothetical protein
VIDPPPERGTHRVLPEEIDLELARQYLELLEAGPLSLSEANPPERRPSPA